MSDDLELTFISGQLKDIPKTQAYLLKYFKTSIQQQFLSYYLSFGNYTRFVEHTGCKCSMRWLHKMKNKLDVLEQVHSVAKKSFDLDALTLIETGKYRWSDE